MSNPNEQYEQTADLIAKAFDLFDSADHYPADRAALMIQAAQATATMLVAREQRHASLLALASVPDSLGVDVTLRREAFQAVVIALGLVEDEAAEPPMTPEQFADLFDQPGTDPADKDVEK